MLHHFFFTFFSSLVHELIHYCELLIRHGSVVVDFIRIHTSRLSFLPLLALTRKTIAPQDFAFLGLHDKYRHLST